MKAIFLSLICVLSFGVLVKADNPTVVLQPGSTATIYDSPTDVVCQAPDAPAFGRYCKCTLGGFSPSYTLSIILDDEGNSDDLGMYPTQVQCEKALSGNPACGAASK